MTDLREPYFSYEELVEMVTDGYRVEGLPTLEAAACEPGERLWLAEQGPQVYRVRRKGRGSRARWRLDFESAPETEAWVSRKLEDSVLDRLQAPRFSREYALDPGLAEEDLAVLEELERVWLAAVRHAGLFEPPGRPYPQPLPAELAPWHVYIEVLGHCIAIAVVGVYKPDGDPWEYMTVAPVRMILRYGDWTMQDGRVLADVPYNTLIGAVECDDDDLEF